MQADFYEQLDRLYETDPKQVEAFLLQTLETCRDAEDDLGMVTVSNELGSLYRGQSRYAESADQFEFAMEMLEDLGMTDSTAYLTSLLNRAGTYRLTGQIRDAVQDFHRVLRLLSEQPGDTAYVRASALNNLGLCYQELGDGEAASEYILKALHMMEDLPGMEAEIASSMNNLAAVYLHEGALDEAANWMERAMEYYEGPAGALDPHQAAAYSSMAAIRYRQGFLRDALEFYKKAASVTLRFFGKTLDYAAILYGSAIVSHDLNAAEDTALLQETILLYEKLLGKGCSMAQNARQLLRQWKQEALR